MQRPDLRAVAPTTPPPAVPPGNSGGPPDSVIRYADSLLARWIRQDPLWRAAQMAFTRGDHARALACLRRQAERPELTPADRLWLRRHMAMSKAKDPEARR